MLYKDLLHSIKVKSGYINFMQAYSLMYNWKRSPNETILWRNRQIEKGIDTMWNWTHNVCDSPEGELDFDINSFCPVPARTNFGIVLDQVFKQLVFSSCWKKIILSLHLLYYDRFVVMRYFYITCLVYSSANFFHLILIFSIYSVIDKVLLSHIHIIFKMVY